MILKRFTILSLAISPHYAQVVVEDILAAIDGLEYFPMLGRSVPEHDRKDLRELIKPPYRIVYRLSKVIYILTIVRTSRSFPTKL
jgi:toxin ParE1/3/4